MKASRFSVTSLSCIVLSLLIGCALDPAKPGYKTTPSAVQVNEGEYNAALPDDIYPESGNRLPIVERDILDTQGKAKFDDVISPDTKTLAGIRGPGGIRLHGSGDLGKSRVDLKTRELVRLIVSREMDQAFEWTVHEPVALKAGLDPEIIDAIRFRRSLTNIPEREASIIQMGREVFQSHKVSSETFARVLHQVGKRDLIDICDYMGNYTRTAILLHVVDAHLPHDQESLLPIP